METFMLRLNLTTYKLIEFQGVNFIITGNYHQFIMRFMYELFQALFSLATYIHSANDYFLVNKVITDRKTQQL